MGDKKDKGIASKIEKLVKGKKQYSVIIVVMIFICILLYSYYNKNSATYIQVSEDMNFFERLTTSLEKMKFEYNISDDARINFVNMNNLGLNNKLDEEDYVYQVWIYDKNYKYRVEKSSASEDVMDKSNYDNQDNNIWTWNLNEFIKLLKHINTADLGEYNKYYITFYDNYILGEEDIECIYYEFDENKYVQKSNISNGMLNCIEISCVSDVSNKNLIVDKHVYFFDGQM